ncbi:High-affinity branched-chain amino acid transport system permease protein LivH [Burkholderia cepacia]|nr:High-affinity branched-chain amino acid transport system permease protein LivH [Burkholderia cepacia]
MLLSYLLNLGYACAALALTTIGLAIVFGLLGVLNMAHGEFIMLGAYSVVVVQRLGLPALLAIPLAIVVCAAVGWIVERVLVRPLYQRPFDTLLATWGVSILLREGVVALFGKGYQDVAGADGASIDVFGTQYPAFRLAMMLAVGVAFAGLAAWYSRSQTGARIRGMVANPLLAKRPASIRPAWPVALSSRVWFWPGWRACCLHRSCGSSRTWVSTICSIRSLCWLSVVWAVCSVSR